MEEWEFDLKPGNGRLGRFDAWKNRSPSGIRFSPSVNCVSYREFDKLSESGFPDPVLTQIGLALWRELEQPSAAGKLYAQSAAQMLAVHLLRHYLSVGRAFKDPSQGLTHQHTPVPGI